MAERLAGGNVALALLANSLATGFGLTALIATFGPISGAHFNPLVTVVDVLLQSRSPREIPAYVAAQLVGAVCGVGLANIMFGLPALQLSRHVRSGSGLFVGEIVATAGLMLVIFCTARTRPRAVSWAVGCYITAAYWFTSSTSFANPAVTLARSLSDTFTGIRWADAGPFILAEMVGATGAFAFLRWLLPTRPAEELAVSKEAAQSERLRQSGFQKKAP